MALVIDVPVMPIMSLSHRQTRVVHSRLVAFGTKASPEISRDNPDFEPPDYYETNSYKTMLNSSAAFAIESA